MILRETTLYVSLSDIISKESVEKSFFNIPYETDFANFDPHTLLVSGFPPIASDEQGTYIGYSKYVKAIQKELYKLPNDLSRFSFLLKNTAWIHEFKHFHDAVCTPMGCSIFMGQWEFIVNSLSLLFEHRKKGKVISQPFAEDYIENVQPGKNLCSNQYHFKLRRIITNADIKMLLTSASPNDWDIVWLESNNANEQFRIPCFPATSDPNDTNQSILIPIGFRAITEAGAILVQVQIIRTFGQRYAKMFLNRLRKFPEYIVLKLFYTRILKKSGIVESHPEKGFVNGEFHEEELFRILNAALSYDLQQGNKLPGEHLIKLFKQYVDNETGKFSMPYGNNLKRLDAFHQKLLENYSVASQEDYCIYQILNIVKDSFSKAFTIYKSNDNEHSQPDELKWYFVFGSSLPDPPISIQGENIGYSLARGIDPMTSYLLAIHGWIILLSIIEQAEKSSTIKCPGLTNQYTIFFKKFVSTDSNCAAELSNKSCGIINLGGDLSYHCNCPWKLMMLNLALAQG